MIKYTEEEWRRLFHREDVNITYRTSHSYAREPCFYTVLLSNGIKLDHNITGYRETSGGFNLRGEKSIRFIETYFQDPVNPTDEENVLFMLEHDLDYKELIQQAKIKKN